MYTFPLQNDHCFLTSIFEKKDILMIFDSEIPKISPSLQPDYLEDHPRTCKWLVSPIYKPFSPFGRGITHLGDLLTMVINHLLNGMILQVSNLTDIFSRRQHQQWMKYQQWMISVQPPLTLNIRSLRTQSQVRFVQWSFWGSLPLNHLQKQKEIDSK